VARIRLDPGNLSDLSKGYFATTFLRGRLESHLVQVLAPVRAADQAASATMMG
jgi:hypothetical protein